MLLDKIHPLYFALAFAIGVFACYVTKPSPDIIVKFPNPWNADHTVYRSQRRDDQCYKFRAEKVACPRDRSLIRPQPLHEDFSFEKHQRTATVAGK